MGAKKKKNYWGQARASQDLKFPFLALILQLQMFYGDFVVWMSLPGSLELLIKTAGGLETSELHV